ncbi:hypothetical protein GIB67_042244 [Kingdonia uniflora]|uniref:F-box domain-containing protein n=1 Tax=Kingdonia uniflora TaxID=39325 RepID=A0A7J7LDS1_9MAGN|nr:hypothetical protein GIB67_042244 [Kingdonia uniflora]
MKLIRCTHKRPDWFQLPVDLIGDIAKRISHIEDFVSFGSVCKSWHSVTLDKNCRSGIRDLPWVMFPEEAMFAEEVLTDRNTFYSLSTKKTYYSHLPKILHELHSCLRISRFGWLMVREYMKTNLLNPLSRVRIQLPSLELEERFFNAVLSASPLSSTSHDNCIVMIINKYQDGLLFCRPGDNSWTTLEQDSMPRHSYGYGFCSIVYFKCQFYALTYDSELWICDVSIPRPKASKLMPDNVASPIEIHSMWLNGFFLVEVGDELLLVYQKMDRDLIGDIAKRVSHIEDFIKFGAVCKAWRSVTLERNCRSGIRDLPWLMSPTAFVTQRDIFFSLSTQKTYNINLPKNLRFCVQGSPFGWWIIRDYVNDEYQIYLLNPLSRVMIQLPPLEQSVSRAFLSSSPLSSSNHNYDRKE